jgi:sugar lactone lactonase YvrE
MRQAREGSHWQDYLTAATRLGQLLNGSPNSWLNLARGEVHLNETAKALAATQVFVDMGQSADLLLTSPEFAVLRDDPGFAALKQAMSGNSSPIANTSRAFDVIEPALVAEDIDFDPRTERFYISSILKHKIIVIDRKGSATDLVTAPDPWPMMALKIDSKRRLLWATEVALKDFSSIPAADRGKSSVLCYDIETKKLLLRVDGPQDSALGDMLLLSNGDPLLSDGAQGGVYRLHPSTKTLERIDNGEFLSPQTAAVSSDGKRAFVPDYLRGIGILDLTTKRVTWLEMQKKYGLNGTDGLYLNGNNLILVQNGTSPERVIVFRLDATMTRIVSSHEIERATKTLGDPTHGVVVGDQFYYIANSGWDMLNDDGTMKKETSWSPVHIMRASLK